jgi:hypothetical protein
METSQQLLDKLAINLTLQVGQEFKLIDAIYGLENRGEVG